MPVDSISQENTILVVDDTPTNLQVLFDLLSEQGYRVAIAKNGETALQRLQSSQPNLILLDVMMPGIDGFETCQRLKANPATRDIPVIFMTALSDSVDKVKGLSVGAVDYITKPIQHEEVLARIRVHLQLRSATRIMEQRTNELNQALESLKQAQMHLVQGEKNGCPWSVGGWNCPRNQQSGEFHPRQPDLCEGIYSRFVRICPTLPKALSQPSRRNPEAGKRPGSGIFTRGLGEDARFDGNG